MASIFAQGAAGGRGHRLDWTLDFDDAADTVTIVATHTQGLLPGGQPASDPPAAAITIELNTSVSISVNLLTGVMSQGGNFSQASPGKIVNAGPKVRTGVRLKVSSGRAAGITFSTQYTPPA